MHRIAISMALLEGAMLTGVTLLLVLRHRGAVGHPLHCPDSQRPP